MQLCRPFHLSSGQDASRRATKWQVAPGHSHPHSSKSPKLRQIREPCLQRPRPLTRKHCLHFIGWIEITRSTRPSGQRVLGTPRPRHPGPSPHTGSVAPIRLGACSFLPLPGCQPGPCPWGELETAGTRVAVGSRERKVVGL